MNQKIFLRKHSFVVPLSKEANTFCICKLLRLIEELYRCRGLGSF